MKYLLLYIVSKLYWLLITIRRLLYKYNFLSSWNFNKNSFSKNKGEAYPLLVSIGNISVGGSGKTPMSIYFSKLLHEHNIEHVIVSRGYKKKSWGTLVVSDGLSAPMANADQCGDEPYLLAIKLPLTPIIVDENKRRAIIYAHRQFNPSVILVDDGFQSLYLKFDYHIVLHSNATTKAEMNLLPLGKLRVPAAEISNSDLIILTKGKDLHNHYQSLCSYNNNIIDSCSQTSLLIWNKSTGVVEPYKNNDKINQRTFLFCGLADGVSFFDDAKKYFNNIVSQKKYSDHCDYFNNEAFEKDSQSAIDNGVKIFVTSYKDFVKIKQDAKSTNLPVEWIVVDIEYHVDVNKLDSFMSLVCRSV